MLRVIQWGAGFTGRYAVEAVHAHPDLELVGALVYSDDKAGRDIGETCGIGPIGVTATQDRDEVLALDADCVLHMSRARMTVDEVLDEICPLLESGKNVVATTSPRLIYPKSAGPEVVARLERACAAGGTSVHGTGIEPGWASEVLPLTMSGVLRRIDSILVQEILSYASSANREIIVDTMGFGLPPDAQVPGADPARPGASFKAPLMLVADALAADVEDYVFEREVRVAEEAFDIAAGRIEIGTVAAQKFSFSAIVGGRKAITIEHVTRVHDSVAPEWPTGRGWKATIEGVPSMAIEAKVGINGEDELFQARIATAMHAVHAIAPVCAAAPGIRTFLDLPLLFGRHTLR